MQSLYVALVNAIGRLSLIVGFFSTITVLDSAHEFGLIVLFNVHVNTFVHC